MMTPYRSDMTHNYQTTDGTVKFWHGDLRDVLPTMPENSVSSVVTDPPYELNFMGKAWDSSGIAFDPETWKSVLRVAKPGAFLLAFGGTRTYHRMVCAIEDAGWEIRDCIMWVYGSGFPKSLDIGKAIDKAAGAEREIVGRRTDRAATPKMDIRGGKLIGDNRSNIDLSAITAPATDLAKQWDGWGTALKPSYEPIVVAMKPVDGTFANNAEKWGVAGLNIDASRIGDSGGSTTPSGMDRFNAAASQQGYRPNEYTKGAPQPPEPKGRWPANLIHDGSEEVTELFPQTTSGALGTVDTESQNQVYGKSGHANVNPFYANSGSAARFFYTAKASRSERESGCDDLSELVKNNHPTVKPLALMRYLCRLVCPQDGIILDPFLGSGSTAVAAYQEHFNCWGIEKENSIERPYFDIACERMRGQINKHPLFS